MIGAAILSKLADLRLEGLVDGDEITATLIAATFAEAFRKGQTPRQILDVIWEQAPTDDDWENGLRECVENALDARDAGIGT